MKRKDQSLLTPRTVQVVLGRVAKEKSMSDAMNVYHSLTYKFRPNLQTFNILLSGWKSSEDAHGFFDELRDLGVELDVVSYNCLVDMYCKGREMEKAFKVVKEMREKDITPDVITYTSLIGGLGLVGQPDKARGVLKNMREYGCYPDMTAYNAAIRNFCIAKRIGDAYGLMDEMIMNGLSPNATTYNVFLRQNDVSVKWWIKGKSQVMFLLGGSSLGSEQVFIPSELSNIRRFNLLAMTADIG
ncbi:PREDICTED: putative pentatricopeptide repeat-containing protein At1g02420 [Nicotiana attenuata]|uniref:putative pentatricopeptide repeat-containing protein At1g02420 n=1 Tax=Nicotiana attenuata TaxID=49451 RepID=UPI000905B582|nr:PREDICTED: putative pentatricopeptide repeat-containing protein At1g02420 [Nicotiana attenuata]